MTRGHRSTRRVSRVIFPRNFPAFHWRGVLNFRPWTRICSEWILLSDSGPKERQSLRVHLTSANINAFMDVFFCTSKMLRSDKRKYVNRNNGFLEICSEVGPPDFVLLIELKIPGLRQTKDRRKTRKF